MAQDSWGKRQRGRRSGGRSLIESVQFTKGSGDLISGRKSNKTINELQNEVNALRESNKLLKKRIGKLEVLLKAKEEEFSRIVVENNRNKIVKDFEKVFDKSWKESCDKEIKNLKTELEFMSAKLKRSETSVIKCDKCGSSFKKTGLLRRHVRLHLKKESGEGRGITPQFFLMKTFSKPNIFWTKKMI